MTTFTVMLEFNADFYREHKDQMTQGQLLKQLKGELQDQLVELNLDDLLQAMLNVKKSFLNKNIAWQLQPLLLVALLTLTSCTPLF